MTERFPTTRLRNRAWLLLWLLPFVLLNFAGESLHNHPILAGAPVATHSLRAAHADSQHQPSRENTRADVSCLACQWHAFSAGNLAAHADCATPPILAASRVLATDVLRARAAVTPSTRGPPFSFA